MNEWHDWFAWYPVYAINSVDPWDRDVWGWVWLRTIERIKLVDSYGRSEGRIHRTKL